MIVSTGRDNKVKVWESNGNAAGEMPALVEAGHEVAITADAMQIAAGDWAGNVRLWPRAKPADEHKLAANPQPLELQLETALRAFDEQRATLAQAQAELARAEDRYATAKEAMTVAYSVSQPATEEMVCDSNECAAIFSYTTKALAKSRAKSDVARTKVEATEKQIADLKADIDKFHHFPEEFAAQINMLEQTIAMHTTKIAPAEELVAAATTRRDAVNAEIANLETQLAALQAKIQAERAKRTVLDTDVLKHQQELDELRAQIQQSDSELVQVKAQRELYQKVFGK
jgi:chromosome segregation ATPase